MEFGKSLERYSEEVEGVELRVADGSITQVDAGSSVTTPLAAHGRVPVLYKRM